MQTTKSNLAGERTQLKLSATQSVSIDPAATFGPEFQFRDNEARPYWKNHGTGKTWFSVTKEKYSKGCVHIKAHNSGEEGKGAKEAWVSIPPEVVKALIEFLQTEFPET